MEIKWKHVITVENSKWLQYEVQSNGELGEKIVYVNNIRRD